MAYQSEGMALRACVCVRQREREKNFVFFVCERQEIFFVCVCGRVSVREIGFLCMCLCVLQKEEEKT